MGITFKPAALISAVVALPWEKLSTEVQLKSISEEEHRGTKKHQGTEVTSRISGGPALTLRSPGNLQLGLQLSVPWDDNFARCHFNMDVRTVWFRDEIRCKGQYPPYRRKKTACSFVMALQQFASWRPKQFVLVACVSMCDFGSRYISATCTGYQFLTLNFIVRGLARKSQMRAFTEVGKASNWPFQTAENVREPYMDLDDCRPCFAMLLQCTKNGQLNYCERQERHINHCQVAAWSCCFWHKTSITLFPKRHIEKAVLRFIHRKVDTCI